MHSCKNTHNHKLKNLPPQKNPPRQKNLVECCKKKSKKNSPKKFKKKLKKGYQDFHAPKQGGGGYGLYKCVMVVACLYAYIDKRTDGIDKHRDREQRDMHKDAETKREAIHPKCLLSGVCRPVGLLWFSWFRFFALHKKIF